MSHPEEVSDLPTVRTVDAERFKAALRFHAAGVAVITADVGGTPVALTASSVTSVSVDPAILLFSVSSTTGTGRLLAEASSAVVHLLDADDHELAVRCADPTSDRFGDGNSWERLPSGEPAFLAPRRLLRGTVRDRLAMGDATIVLLAVTEVIERAHDRAGEASPLAYVDRTWHSLGPASTIG